MSEYIIELNNITKLYPGVVALDDITIKVKRGTVHALVGENGAGKSTLIKVLSGAVKPDSGQIILEGEKFSSFTPQMAIKKGIGVVYQEFNLIPQLSVTENIFFKREIKKGILLDMKKMDSISKEKMENLGIYINTKTKVRDLSIAYQQLVEITKIVSQNAKVIVLDEPSAPLTNQEQKHLYRLIANLKEKGITVIYISHRLEEIFEICDTVSVMRDGKHVITENVASISRKELIEHMVGREIINIYPERKNKIGDVVIKAENLCNEKLRDISFELRKGEVLGIAGLVGAGRTELARSLFGADTLIAGEVFYNDKKVKIKSPKQAINMGIGLIPEDRKGQGVLLHMSVEDNISFSNYQEHTKLTVLKRKEIKELVAEYISQLNIKTPSAKQKVAHLSGGNQQKVVVAKWLATHSDIIIFDEPTRGIDVGAKHEIYLMINELLERGKSIIMVSSEMPELIGMSDRIIVMCEGRITGCLDKSEFEQKRIMELAAGI
ncbi:MAG: sugar ABC transporter ATP-binding protein [Eubacteriales bacterium]|nr:sugar ABC transporter ATP-binding protein [Eubacteriales bacterium]